MKYYLININVDKENKVDFWIDRKMLPIFYGSCTAQQIIDDDGHGISRNGFRDAQFFIKTINGRISNKCLIFLAIGKSKLYLISPMSDVTDRYEEKRKSGACDLIKACDIEIKKEILIRDCPLIISSIKANRYLSSGTFKSLSEEKNFGNIKAVEYLLSGKNIKVKSYKEYLQCLSSLEFETLVAKIFEEIGFFVPAYKGGYIKDYDLFVRNKSGNSLAINDKFIINPGESMAIQIKLKISKADVRDNNSDLFFSIDSEIVQDNIFDYNLIKNMLEKLPITSEWLANTLFWVDPFRIIKPSINKDGHK